MAQSWWVRATGLNEGDSVSLQDQHGRNLITAKASQEGTAEASVVMEEAGADTALTIARNDMRMSLEEYQRRADALPIPGSEPTTSLGIKQAQLVRLAQIHLDGRFTRMSMEYHNGGIALFVITDSGLRVYASGAEASDSTVWP